MQRAAFNFTHFLFYFDSLDFAFEETDNNNDSSTNNDHKNRKQHNTEKKQKKKKKKNDCKMSRFVFIGKRMSRRAHAHGLFVYARLVNRSKSNEKCFFVFFLRHTILILAQQQQTKEEGKKQYIATKYKNNKKFNPTETNVRVADYQFKPFCE